MRPVFSQIQGIEFHRVGGPELDPMAGAMADILLWSVANMGGIGIGFMLGAGVMWLTNLMAIRASGL